jgi:hypothetical protein
LTLIRFSHLLDLDVGLALLDYAEQYLCQRKTYLPLLYRLTIEYQTLLTITKNFTNDETRIKCSHLRTLVIREPFVRSENFHSYFPRCK